MDTLKLFPSTGREELYVRSSLKDKIRNKKIRRRTKITDNIAQTISKLKSQWADHASRMIGGTRKVPEWRRVQASIPYICRRDFK